MNSEVLDNLIFFTWVITIIPFWIFLKKQFPDEEFDGLNFLCEMVGSICWPLLLLGYGVVIFLIKIRHWRNYVRRIKRRYSDWIPR